MIKARLTNNGQRPMNKAWIRSDSASQDNEWRYKFSRKRCATVYKPSYESQKSIHHNRGSHDGYAGYSYEEYMCDKLIDHIEELNELRKDVSRLLENTRFSMRLMQKRCKSHVSLRLHPVGNAYKTARQSQTLKKMKLSKSSTQCRIRIGTQRSLSKNRTIESNKKRIKEESNGSKTSARTFYFKDNNSKKQLHNTMQKKNVRFLVQDTIQKTKNHKCISGLHLARIYGQSQQHVLP